MTWEELETKHAEQCKRYFEEQKQALAALLQSQAEIETAFFDSEADMPDSLRERFRNEIKEHETRANETWATLKAAQKKEIDNQWKIDRYRDQVNALHKRSHVKETPFEQAIQKQIRASEQNPSIVMNGIEFSEMLALNAKKNRDRDARDR